MYKKIVLSLSLVISMHHSTCMAVQKAEIILTTLYAGAVGFMGIFTAGTVIGEGILEYRRQKQVEYEKIYTIGYHDGYRNGYEQAETRLKKCGNTESITNG